MKSASNSKMLSRLAATANVEARRSTRNIALQALNKGDKNYAEGQL